MLTDITARWNSWSLARARGVLVALAVCVPLAGILYGSASGVPLDRLGGVMIAYWAFLSLSLVAAIVEFFRHSDRSSSWLLLICSMVAVPVGAKIAAGLVTEAVPELPSPSTSSQTAASGKGCRSELISRDTAPVQDSKQGHSSRIAWHLWFGNYYEWQVRVSITADDSGASGSASADGKTSSWYSLVPHLKSARASARGNITCRAVSESCICFADGSSDRKTDGDYLANVDVESVVTTSGASLKVTTSSGLSGTMAVSGISIGADPVRATLQGPNSARDAVFKAKGYSYGCFPF